MDWYTRYLRKKAADLQGEWWIMDGYAAYCDIDIGEWGHESYVVDTIASEYVDTEKLEGTPGDWFFSLTEKQIADLGITPQEAEILAGGDARMYAIEHLGWQRMAGNNVETWTLTSNDLRNIVQGIGDAYPHAEDSDEFTIEVRKSGQTYWDVPLSVLESGNPMELVHYRR